MAYSAENHIEVDGECLSPVRISRPIGSHSSDDYNRYLHMMPDELQKTILDAIVICSQNDYNNAKKFKNHLATDICFRFGDRIMKPQVQLLCDIRGYDDLDFLEKLFERTIYIFLFLTKSFCEGDLTKLLYQACLHNTLDDPQKRWTVIPVHTLQKEYRNYKEPFLLKALKPLEYLRVDQFYKESVIDMFQRVSDIRVAKEVKLEEMREEYFKLHKDKLIKMAKISDSTLSHHPLSQRHHHTADISLHSLGVKSSRTEDQKKTNKDTISCSKSDIEIDGPVACRGSPRKKHTPSNEGFYLCNENRMPGDQIDNWNTSSNQSLAVNEFDHVLLPEASSVSRQNMNSKERNYDSLSLSSLSVEPSSSSLNSRQKSSLGSRETPSYTANFPSKNSDLVSSPLSSFSKNGSTNSSNLLNSLQSTSTTSSSQQNIIHNHYYTINVENADKVAIGSHASIIEKKSQSSESCESADSDSPDDRCDNLVIGREPSTDVEYGRHIYVPPAPRDESYVDQNVMQEGFCDLNDLRFYSTTSTSNATEFGSNVVDETFVKRL